MKNEQLWQQISNILESTVYPQENQNIFLFGAGLNCALAVPLLKDHLNLVAVCDNDRKKQGQLVEGIPCIAPGDLTKYNNKFVLISSVRHYQSIYRELQAMKIPCCGLDAYVMHKNLSLFQQVFLSLDEESRRVYAGVLLCRLLGDMQKFESFCSDSQYFYSPRFRYIGPGDTFVDCGASTGDVVGKVIENAAGVFSRIYAFEPNENAYIALQKRVRFLREIWALSDGQIVCVPKGVGSENARLSFRNNEPNPGNKSISTFSNDDYDECVEIVSLDTYFRQNGEEKITCIKADIEGFEWNMLHGAKQTICQYKPNLAICIYHSIFDFFRIPIYIQELVPTYKLAVRHHWNSVEETVLYCYVDGEPLN